MSTIKTDGCTGFPDHVGGKDLTACCSVHDDGASDGYLVDCLTALDPASYWWALAVIVGVAAMRLLRPGYNLLQRWGVLPRTKGSNF